MKHGRTWSHSLLVLGLFAAATSHDAHATDYAMSVAALQGFSTETIMRGNTGVAIPGPANTWAVNPALLAPSAAPPTEGGRRVSVSVDTDISGDLDITSLNFGGIQFSEGLALGLGYTNFDFGKAYGLGAGRPLGDFSVGLSWRTVKIDGGPFGPDVFRAQAGPDIASLSENVFDLGLGGIFELFDWGLVVRDATDQLNRHFDVGFSHTLDDGTLIALDIRDLTGAADRTVHIGATKHFGRADEIMAGVGLSDGNLTVGVRYDLPVGGWGRDWGVGLAWMDGDRGVSSSLFLGAFGTFEF